MPKEIALVVILLSLSTLLKVCSLVVLCQDHHHPEELEHDHPEVTFMVKKEASQHRFNKG